MEKEERKEVYGKHNQLLLLSLCFKLIDQCNFSCIKIKKWYLIQFLIV